MQYDEIPTLTLTPCPACGQDVSVAAASCPRCGHPLAAAHRRPAWPGMSASPPTITTQATGKEAKAAVAVGGALVIAGLVTDDALLSSLMLVPGVVLLLAGWIMRWWRYG